MDLLILYARRLRRWAPVLAALALALLVLHWTGQAQRAARLAVDAAGAAWSEVASAAADARALWDATRGVRATLARIADCDDVRACDDVKGASEADIAQFNVLARSAARLGLTRLAPALFAEASTLALAPGSSVTMEWAPGDVAGAVSFAQVEPLFGQVFLALAAGPTPEGAAAPPACPRIERQLLDRGRAALLAVFGDCGATLTLSCPQACRATLGPWSPPSAEEENPDP